MTAFRKAFLCLVLLPSFATFAQVPQATPAAATQADDQPAGIPKFYAQSRQILIAATVRDPNKIDASWIPKISGKKEDKPTENFFTIHPPVLGLHASSFHVFDNGIEQPINYFKEVDFPGANQSNQWSFHADNRGIWSFFMSGLALGPPTATYLLGYAPPALQAGECRILRVVAQGYDVQLNRERYCAVQSDDSLMSTKMGLQLQEILKSRKKGSIAVSVKAFTFWSSGVLSLTRQTPVSPNPTIEPTTEYKYTVEVHDAKAPATVQVVAGFPGLGGLANAWAYDCPQSATIHLLVAVYTAQGDLARQVSDSYPCRKVSKDEQPGQTDSDLRRETISIPERFDTEIQLPPGEYELHVVVNDGKNFGQAYTPLHIEPLDPNVLAISDLVLAGVVRYSGWVLLDAAALTPSPIVPSPLVSKDLQYFPDSDSGMRLRKRLPLPVYFEIYKPQLPTETGAIYYQWRITNEKTGSVVSNSATANASEWTIPASAVVPVGLKLDIQKLKKGVYKIEVQASDSAGNKSQWRSANFKIQ